MGLGVVWILGALAVQSGTYRIRMEVQRSAILQRLNTVLPPSGPLLNSLRRLDPFPRIDGPEARVAPPQAGITRDPEVQAAAASVVKILGTACGLGVAGSGWVAGDGLVVTNAHVVAGEDDTRVLPGGREPGRAAQAVYFDPRNDIAILRVDGLDEAPLELAADPAPSTSAAILGFPLNGPFDARPGRLGVTRRVQSSDAYGRGPVERSMTALRGLVRSGNSGGPMVDGGRAAWSRPSSPPPRAGPAAATACRTRWCGAHCAMRAVRSPPARARASALPSGGPWARRWSSPRSRPWARSVARPPGRVPEARGLPGDRHPRHDVGRRPPRAARRARRVRPEVQEVAHGRPADRARRVQARRARRALQEADERDHAAAQARRRRPRRERVRRRARGRADLRLDVREGERQEARRAALALLDDDGRDQAGARRPAPGGRLRPPRGGGAVALGGRLDRGHERDPRGHDPAALVVRRRRLAGPGADARRWR